MKKLLFDLFPVIIFFVAYKIGDANAEATRTFLAGLGLAGRKPTLRRFDAVHHRIAQQVLEGRQHALEHLAVQLAGRAIAVDAGPQ